MLENDSQNFKLELNKKFGMAQLNAQDMTSIVMAWQGGLISQESALWNFKQGHRLPSDVSIDDEIANTVNQELGLPGGGE